MGHQHHLQEWVSHSNMMIMLMANGICVWPACCSAVPKPPVQTTLPGFRRCLLVFWSTKLFVTVTWRRLHAGRTLHRWLHETKLRVMHKKGHCHSSGVIRNHHHQIQEIGTSAFSGSWSSSSGLCMQSGGVLLQLTSPAKLSLHKYLHNFPQTAV